MRGSLIARVVCISLLIEMAPPVSATQQMVAGYYADWTVSSYPPSAIKMQNLTHIIHAFVWPDANGALWCRQGFFAIVPDLTQRAHSAGKKVILSVGGYSDSAGFSPMAANPAARAAFATHLADLCLSYRYDGVDLDWEFPENAIDKQNLTLLVREMRAHFDRVAPGLTISMTVAGSFWWGQYYDVEALHPVLAWIGVMTY